MGNPEAHKRVLTPAGSSNPIARFFARLFDTSAARKARAENKKIVVEKFKYNYCGPGSPWEASDRVVLEEVVSEAPPRIISFGLIAVDMEDAGRAFPNDIEIEASRFRPAKRNRMMEILNNPDSPQAAPLKDGSRQFFLDAMPSGHLKNHTPYLQWGKEALPGESKSE